VNNKQVAALFIQGKPAKGSNFFSPDGKTLFSYGSHFIVGQWRDGKLFENSAKYSPSTSRHQHHFRTAARLAGVETIIESIA
jgi:hypothetical protein